MTRFLTIALRRRLAAAGPAVGDGACCSVALACVVMSVVLRLIVDAIAPGALALGIVYPCCLLATLLIGWRSQGRWRW